MLSASHGFADALNLRAHAVKGNRFVIEGGHFDFEEISSILKQYGIERLQDSFMLIGLAQNDKTSDAFFSDLRTYDTENDWTYSLDDDALRAFSEMSVAHNVEMTEYMLKYGFTIYDTSTNREQVLNRIIDDIKRNLL